MVEVDPEPTELGALVVLPSGLITNTGRAGRPELLRVALLRPGSGQIEHCAAEMLKPH